MSPALHEIALHNQIQVAANAKGLRLVSLPHQKLWGLLERQSRIVATADNLWTLAHHVLPVSEIK